MHAAGISRLGTAFSLYMNRGLGSVTVVAFLILACGMATTCNGPFEPAYAPRYHLLEWAFLGGATYVFGTYVVARTAGLARLARMLIVQGALLGVAIAAFTVYHVDHGTGPQPALDDWGLHWVTPFHEQLAVPAFLALVLAPLIVVVAQRSARARRALTW